jgi:hypothetical protein
MNSESKNWPGAQSPGHFFVRPGLTAAGVLVMANGVITLGEMRDRGMTMLEVACDRCPRYGSARLIDSRLDLRRVIAHDCPRMIDPHVSVYERCGVLFLELPKWF